MKILKIRDGRITLYNERGLAISPTFGNDIISAYLNDKEDLILATFLNGKVDLLNVRGLVQRTIVNSNAVDARFSGDKILVVTKSERTEIRSYTGLLVKII